VLPSRKMNWSRSVVRVFGDYHLNRTASRPFSSSEVTGGEIFDGGVKFMVKSSVAG